MLHLRCACQTYKWNSQKKLSNWCVRQGRGQWQESLWGQPSVLDSGPHSGPLGQPLSWSLQFSPPPRQNLGEGELKPLCFPKLDHHHHFLLHPVHACSIHQHLTRTYLLPICFLLLTDYVPSGHIPRSCQLNPIFWLLNFFFNPILLKSDVRVGCGFWHHLTRSILEVPLGSPTAVSSFWVCLSVALGKSSFCSRKNLIVSVWLFKYPSYAIYLNTLCN